MAPLSSAQTYAGPRGSGQGRAPVSGAKTAGAAPAQRAGGSGVGRRPSEEAMSGRPSAMSGSRSERSLAGGSESGRPSLAESVGGRPAAGSGSGSARPQALTVDSSRAPGARSLAVSFESPTGSERTPTGATSPFLGKIDGALDFTDGALELPVSVDEFLGGPQPMAAGPAALQPYMARSRSADSLSDRAVGYQPRTNAVFHRMSSVNRLGGNPAVDEFHEWVNSIPDGWTQIHHLFIKEDTNPAGGHYGDKGSHGMRGIGKKRWLNLLACKGFKSELSAGEVFDEIAKELQVERKKALDLAEPPAEASITLAQLKRFERKCVSVASMLASSNGQSFAARFVKLLVQQRGCVLRAWKMDIDKRGTGRVAFVDFCNACRELHMAPQGKLVWNNVRQDRVTPLELRELDAREAANLEDFSDTLWRTVGFDLTKAWQFLDTNNQNYLTYEDFKAGSDRLGFQGDARLLYRGLDGSGLGRLRRVDLEYLAKVSRTAHRKLGGSGQMAGPVAELIMWMHREIGGPEQLISELRLGAQDREIAVADLAARFTALGFEGDALGAATKAARSLGGTRLTAGTLFSLLCGGKTRKECSTPSPKSPSSPSARSPGSSTGRTARPQGGWCDSVDNLSEHNTHKCKYTRSYFKGHTRAQLDNGSPIASSPPRLHRPRRPLSPSLMGRPAWEDNFDAINQSANEGLSSHCRTYFSDPCEKPVREQRRAIVTRKRAQAEERQQMETH